MVRRLALVAVPLGWILSSCGSGPVVGVNCPSRGGLAPLLFNVHWAGEDPGRDGPIVLSGSEVATVTLTATGQCTGAMKVDFWVTRSSAPSGTGSSHVQAVNLVWDWTDANAGRSPIYDLSSTMSLIWPREDNQGRNVSPGKYFAHMTFTSAGGWATATGANFVVE